MNGGVNGMMEESKELPHTASPDKSHDRQIVTSENTGINTKPNEIINTGLSNQEDSVLASSQDTDINLTKLNTSSNEDYEPKKSNQEKNSTFTVTSPETQCNLLENNSNKKNLQSDSAEIIVSSEKIGDSQPKSEPSEHQMLLNEKPKEEILNESKNISMSLSNGSKENSDSQLKLTPRENNKLHNQKCNEELHKDVEDDSITSNNESSQPKLTPEELLRQQCKEALLRDLEDDSNSCNESNRPKLTPHQQHVQRCREALLRDSEDDSSSLSDSNQSCDAVSLEESSDDLYDKLSHFKSTPCESLNQDDDDSNSSDKSSQSKSTPCENHNQECDAISLEESENDSNSFNKSSQHKLTPHEQLIQECTEALFKDSDDDSNSSNNESKENADSRSNPKECGKPVKEYEELLKEWEDDSTSSNNEPKANANSPPKLLSEYKKRQRQRQEEVVDNSLSSNIVISDEGESERDNSFGLGEARVEETVSIHSDSEVEIQDVSSPDNLNRMNMELEMSIRKAEREHLPKSKNCASLEVLEIVSDNDDCIIEEEQLPPPVKKTSVQLRRSNRAIKRKRYDIDEIENGDISDSYENFEGFRRKSKAIAINNSKTLADMAAKQIKTGLQKKDPTVVIVDTNSSMSSNKGSSIRKPSMPSNNSALCGQSLYQSIVSRGTTVTPVCSKPIVHNLTASGITLLPYLTDDMFVVEAPSFIVPYVYEKPSIKPFRDFVDDLGDELEKQKAKEKKEQNDKKEQEKLGGDKKEEKGKGEDSDEEIETAKKVKLEDTKLKKREDRKVRRRQRNDDDVSWDGESSSESDDDVASDEEDKTIIIKDKADVIDNIDDVTDLTVEKVVTGKSDNYFDLSLGKFFMNIGLNLVQEFVQNDLLKQQNRKLNREKKGGHSTKITETSIACLMKNLELSKQNNSPYKFKHHKCEFCTFKTESSLVMAHHLETPHMKNSVYKCNFCVYESRSPHDILYHMEAEHNTRGKLDRAPAYHQCVNCPFEDNGKGKLARHLVSCAKKFKPELNLAPPVEWEPPAKIPKIAKARNPMLNAYYNPCHRGQVATMGRPPMSINNVMSSPGYRPRARMPYIPRTAPMQAIPVLRPGVTVRHSSSSVIMSPNFSGNNGRNLGVPKSAHQPSISITPLPRHPQPSHMPVLPPTPQQPKNTCVICEICDGYIKDLEQLRNHMQWIHKVKIHPKMIYNRPPLNCQKCQFRFFTDQGLERHLLGSHGLVTSSMQDAANKGKDAGRCPVCGRVYQWKLLTHVARDHSLTLKPAHLSYKCTVCTATFGMYKQFENHVYSAHSVVAKRVMDKGKTPPPVKAGQSLLKPLTINDEISIIPQPTKLNASTLKDK